MLNVASHEPGDFASRSRSRSPHPCSRSYAGARVLVGLTLPPGGLDPVSRTESHGVVLKLPPKSDVEGHRATSICRAPARGHAPHVSVSLRHAFVRASRQVQT